MGTDALKRTQKHHEISYKWLDSRSSETIQLLCVAKENVCYLILTSTRTVLGRESS